MTPGLQQALLLETCTLLGCFVPPETYVQLALAALRQGALPNAAADALKKRCAGRRDSKATAGAAGDLHPARLLSAAHKMSVMGTLDADDRDYAGYRDSRATARSAAGDLHPAGLLRSARDLHTMPGSSGQALGACAPDCECCDLCRLS